MRVWPIWVPSGVLAGLALFLAASASAQSPVPDLSGKDSHWIKDADKNCWAANPTPEPGESVAWTGACEDGLVTGEGTLTWSLKGKVVGRDTGTFKGGELSGYGRITQTGGPSFEGEFPGKGVLTFPNGKKAAAQSVKEEFGWSIEQYTPPTR
jgi:hypothetical protein